MFPFIAFAISSSVLLIPSCSSIAVLSVSSFAFCALFITLLSPNSVAIVIPARINKTTIVTTSATSVIPCILHCYSFFFSHFLFSPSVSLFHFFLCIFIFLCFSYSIITLYIFYIFYMILVNNLFVFSQIIISL